MLKSLRNINVSENPAKTQSLVQSPQSVNANRVFSVLESPNYLFIEGDRVDHQLMPTKVEEASE